MTTVTMYFCYSYTHS